MDYPRFGYVLPGKGDLNRFGDTLKKGAEILMDKKEYILGIEEKVIHASLKPDYFDFETNSSIIEYLQKDNHFISSLDYGYIVFFSRDSYSEEVPFDESIWFPNVPMRISLKEARKRLFFHAFTGFLWRGFDYGEGFFCDADAAQFYKLYLELSKKGLIKER